MDAESGNKLCCSKRREYIPGLYRPASLRRRPQYMAASPNSSQLPIHADHHIVNANLYRCTTLAARYDCTMFWQVICGCWTQFGFHLSSPSIASSSQRSAMPRGDLRGDLDTLRGDREILCGEILRGDSDARRGDLGDLDNLRGDLDLPRPEYLAGLCLDDLQHKAI